MPAVQVVRLGMFEVHCGELIRALALRAEAVCDKLLACMSQDHLDANKAYVTFLSFIHTYQFFLLATGRDAIHFNVAYTHTTTIQIWNSCLSILIAISVADHLQMV